MAHQWLNICARSSCNHVLQYSSCIPRTNSIQTLHRLCHLAKSPVQALYCRMLIRQYSLQLTPKKSRLEGSLKEKIWREPVVPLALQETMVSSKGIQYRTAYTDEGSKSDPIILCLHGSPGSSQDFASLVDTLTSGGCRVIAPNFPGFGRTSVEGEGKYIPSTPVMADFIQDFLQRLEIQKVEVLLAHSAGTVVAYHLAAMTDIFSSLVALGFVGFTPHKTARPQSVIRFMVSLMDFPVLGNFLKSKVLPRSFNYLGFTETDPDILYTSSKMVSLFDFPRNKVYAKVIRDKGLPVVLAQTKSDRIVDWQYPWALATEGFGIKPDNILNIDAEGRYSRGNVLDWLDIHPRFLLFERGGHNLHNSHSSLLSQHILHLVKHVQKVYKES